MTVKETTSKPIVPASSDSSIVEVTGEKKKKTESEATVQDSSVRVRDQKKPETVNHGELAKLQGAKPMSSSFLQAVGGTLGVQRTDPDCGIQLDAHIGVPGDQVPPPPPLPRLKGLRVDEAAVQKAVVDAVEKDPDRFAQAYFDKVRAGELGDAENIFSVDDAKLIFPQYNVKGAPDDEAKAARARYNTVVHQAAAAVAKRAFLKQLDTLEPGAEVLVTNGGCAAGKSYALQNTKGAMVSSMGAVWDAAGEAGGTENKWILDECRKRGLEVTFVYVHADPLFTWADEKRGVITRAERKGRMVNALSFVESYVLGAQNFDRFRQKYEDANDVHFIILDNTSQPLQLAKLPTQALEINGEELYGQVLRAIDDRQPSEPILRGGTISRDIWGEHYA